MAKWKPSKSDRAAYGEKMREIEAFCKANGISTSFSGDSYYFTLNGKQYRISNHTIEASDARAFREDGTQWRDLYHGGREHNTVYITASKTRIIEIYTDLQAGIALDARGRRI